MNGREKRGWNEWRNKDVDKNYRNNFSITSGRCCGRSTGHVGPPKFLIGLQGGEIVDSSKLDQGRKDKCEADSDEPVHGGGIGHLW